MTNEELVEKIQQGERDLLPQLWEQVERFVAKVAVRWAKAVEADNVPQAIEFSEELIHTGYIAVVEAAEAYSPEQDATFVYFLSFYLKKHFTPECAARAGISRGIYGSAHAALQKKKQGLELSGREQKMLGACFPTSLNTPVGDGRRDDDRGELGDLIPDPADAFADADERIFQQQLHDKLEEAMDTLEPEECQAIKLQYYQEMDRKAVAEELGISYDRAKAIEAAAMRKLRHPSIITDLESYIERRTPYFLHVGVEAFHSSGTSAVERIVMLREQMRERKGG